MSDILIALDDVTRQYTVGSNIVFALKSVTCAIKAQEHVAVMGASGSGKSTLLAVMAALDEPDFGNVTWPFNSDKALLRPKGVSVSFQSPSLLPSLTLQQNVEVPLLVLDASDVEKKAALALDRLGIGHLRGRYPDEVSGGQAQRASLARAMVTAPKLLFADEPTGQLDQSTGQNVIKALIDWADENKSTLVVATHDNSVAQKFHKQWRMSFGSLNVGEPQ